MSKRFRYRPHVSRSWMERCLILKQMQSESYNRIEGLQDALHAAQTWRRLWLAVAVVGWILAGVAWWQ